MIAEKIILYKEKEPITTTPTFVFNTQSKNKVTKEELHDEIQEAISRHLLIGSVFNSKKTPNMTLTILSYLTEKTVQVNQKDIYFIVCKIEKDGKFLYQTVYSIDLIEKTYEIPKSS